MNSIPEELRILAFAFGFGFLMSLPGVFLIALDYPITCTKPPTYCANYIQVAMLLSAPIYCTALALFAIRDKFFFVIFALFAIAFPIWGSGLAAMDVIFQNYG